MEIEIYMSKYQEHVTCSYGYKLSSKHWRRLEDMSGRRLEDVLEVNKMFVVDICI